MGFIKNEDLIYNKLSYETKNMLIELQHEMFSNDSAIYSLDISGMNKNEYKILETFLILKGYYTEIDETKIYIRLYE